MNLAHMSSGMRSDFSELIGAAARVSDEIGLRYFAQTDDWFRAVTA